MSLTVCCLTCVHPTNSRQVVQWRQGNCAECAESCVERHLAEHPGHHVEISGNVSETPFGDAPKQIRQLFGRSA